MMKITMKELKTKLSVSLGVLKGFCFNGILCKGWMEVNGNVIEFLQADNRTVRITLDDIVEINKFKIYDEHNGFNKPYTNVVTKS